MTLPFFGKVPAVTGTAASSRNETAVDLSSSDAEDASMSTATPIQQNTFLCSTHTSSRPHSGGPNAPPPPPPGSPPRASAAPMAVDAPPPPKAIANREWPTQAGGPIPFSPLNPPPPTERHPLDLLGDKPDERTSDYSSADCHIDTCALIAKTICDLIRRLKGQTVVIEADDSVLAEATKHVHGAMFRLQDRDILGLMSGDEMMMDACVAKTMWLVNASTLMEKLSLLDKGQPVTIPAALKSCYPTIVAGSSSRVLSSVPCQGQSASSVGDGPPPLAPQGRVSPATPPVAGDKPEPPDDMPALELPVPQARAFRKKMNEKFCDEEGYHAWQNWDDVKTGGDVTLIHQICHELEHEEGMSSMMMMMMMMMMMITTMIMMMTMTMMMMLMASLVVIMLMRFFATVVEVKTTMQMMMVTVMTMTMMLKMFVVMMMVMMTMKTMMMVIKTMMVMAR